MLRDSLYLNAAHVGERIDDWYDEEPASCCTRRGAARCPGSGWTRSPTTTGTGPRHWTSWSSSASTTPGPVTGRPCATWRQRHGGCSAGLTVRRPGRGRVPGVPPAIAGRRGEPGLEGRLERHCGRTRPAGDRRDRDQRVAGLPLRGAAARRAGPGARSVTGCPAVRLMLRAARLRRRFDPAYWMPELRLLRDGPRPGRPAGTLGRLQRRAPAGDRHRARGAGRMWWPAACSSRTCSAAGPCVPSPPTIRRTTRSATTAAASGRSRPRPSAWDWPGTAAGPTAPAGRGTFPAAALFEAHRLPEVLSGLPATRRTHIRRLPAACSPQAWSASAVVALCRHCWCCARWPRYARSWVDPHLPEWLSELELVGVQVGPARSTCGCGAVVAAGSRYARAVTGSGAAPADAAIPPECCSVARAMARRRATSVTGPSKTPKAALLQQSSSPSC